MSSSNDESDSDCLREQVAQGSHIPEAQLEIARRIALETLEADHQALELEVKLTPRFRPIGGS